MASRQEWSEQIELAHLLDTWLPADCFWTATDPVASSALSGAMRRMRGVKPGVPDVLIWYCGKTIKQLPLHRDRTPLRDACREGLPRPFCEARNSTMNNGFSTRPLVRFCGWDPIPATDLNRFTDSQTRWAAVGKVCSSALPLS
ncbi:MAG TPA: hypothetical protein VGJ20_01945 [Xanthobacteraceae bacterium]|jgi:hypothetical protein